MGSKDKRAVRGKRDEWTGSFGAHEGEGVMRPGAGIEGAEQQVGWGQLDGLADPWNADWEKSGRSCESWELDHSRQAGLEKGALVQMGVSGPGPGPSRRLSIE